MKIAFLGCTKYSERILKCLLQINAVEICAIFSIPKEFNISYSEKPVTNANYADLRLYADKLKVPFFEVDAAKGKRITDYSDQLQKLQVDLLLVMGWYYMVPEKTRSLCRYGAWGIHASLLPDYAGGAPLVWAMIEGRKTTGVTLFCLSNGVDDGDIIEQADFTIADQDTIKEVYEKATIASENILKTVFAKNYQINPKEQNKSEIKIYPQRKPEDGKINWGWDAERISRFVRAQTKPYPGAWTMIGNKQIILWDIDIKEL